MAENELLDYYDTSGAWLGIATRKDVHARGLWHRTLHLWLVTPEDEGAVFYQLRADTTANWPGKLDASVAGHLLAGEGFAEALRESEEEIGIAVPPGAAIMLGERREEHPDPGGGWNRELQGVYIALLDPAWGQFDAVDHEAAGLFCIGLPDGLRLHHGDTDSLECDALIAEAGRVVASLRTVRREDFVQRPGYYPRVHAAAARLIRGESAERLVEAYDIGT